MKTTDNLRADLRHTLDLAHAASDPATQDSLIAAAEALQAQLRTAERDDTIRNIGVTGTVVNDGETFASAILAEGWSLKGENRVMVDQEHALRLKTGSIDEGSSIEDAVPTRYVAAGLGLDLRHIFPHVATIPVDPDVTSAQTFRQASRSLAAAADMLRSIDETSTKPETSTVAEPVSVPLKQVATISSSTPNVLLAGASFKSWVNQDLLAAWRRALDTHIIDELTAAEPPRVVRRPRRSTTSRSRRRRCRPLATTPT